MVPLLTISQIYLTFPRQTSDAEHTISENNFSIFYSQDTCLLAVIAHSNYEVLCVRAWTTTIKSKQQTSAMIWYHATAMLLWLGCSDLLKQDYSITKEINLEYG